MCSRDKVIRIHPSVEWAVADDADQGTIRVERYALNPYTLVDGIPAYEFKNDESWKKLPKGWTHNTDLLGRRVSISEERKKMIEACAHVSIKNPDDILQCIERGWLIPARLADVYVEAEIDHKQYRIVRHSDRWNISKAPYSRLMCDTDVFDSYDAALDQAQSLCLDWRQRVTKEREIDREDDIYWVLSKVPEDQRECCEMIVRNLPYGLYAQFRVFEDAVLYRNTYDGQWETVFDIEEKKGK